MSTNLKSPNRLKDLECKKGQLGNWPPVLYFPVRVLVTTKEEPQLLKVKLPNDTCLNVPIYSHGDTEEYLAHVVVVIHIIKQKGLDARCRNLGKAVVKLSETLKNLLEAAGSKDAVLLDDDIEAHKVEIDQTQQMLHETLKQHDKAIAKMYKQLRNLLSSDLQSKLDCICRKMHKCDLWAGVNGQVSIGRHPRMWTSFLDCLELHKLMVFSADAA
jgi:hypothetical protein